MKKENIICLRTAFMQTTWPGGARITISRSKSNGPRRIPIKSYTCVVVLDSRLLRVSGARVTRLSLVLRRHDLALTLSFESVHCQKMSHHFILQKSRLVKEVRVLLCVRVQKSGRHLNFSFHNKHNNYKCYDYW
jgi:hypothetical protein